MIRKEKGVLIYVSPEFRTSLKLASVKDGCSMVDLTRRLARDLTPVVVNGVEVNSEKKRFSFRL
jgi:hypothetical protein